jgi:hypothetical protein
VTSYATGLRPGRPARNHLLWLPLPPGMTSGESMRSSRRPDLRRCPAEGWAAAAFLVGRVASGQTPFHRTVKERMDKAS